MRKPTRLAVSAGVMAAAVTVVAGVGIGNHQVQITTGFTVSTPAVAYWWEYSMRDGGGTSSHTHGGGQASGPWTTGSPL